jgi:hypothetical protein
LQALEYADVVIAIGGRVSNTANTLLHLAEAKRIPVVPFAFLGGASARAFNRRDWQNLYPGLDYNLLSDKEGVDRVMEIADSLVADRMRGVRFGNRSLQKFFISRANAESNFSNELQVFLGSKGLTSVIGDREIGNDRMIQPSIEDAILKSDVCVVMWSKAYAASPWCSDELELALTRERANGIKIWLFNLDGSDVVPRAARKIPQAVTRTPAALVEAVAALLSPTT